MRINFNSSLGTLNQINKTSKNLSKVFEQLSSGKKLNKAGDNPAASALVNSLKSNISGLETANRNISSARSTLNVASGAIGQSVEQLQGLRDLAVQAANGTLSSEDRANLNQQFQQGVSNLDDIASNTQFNGQNLLDGSFNSSIQVGSQAGQSSSVSIGNLSSSGLEVNGQDLSTQEGAEDAIEAIDSAIQRAVSEQSRLGASDSALEFRESANAVERENLEAARSQTEDADLAEVTSNLSREKLLQEAQISVLKAQLKQKVDTAKALINPKK